MSKETLLRALKGDAQNLIPSCCTHFTQSVPRLPLSPHVWRALCPSAAQTLIFISTPLHQRARACTLAPLRDSARCARQLQKPYPMCMNPERACTLASSEMARISPTSCIARGSCCPRPAQPDHGRVGVHVHQAPQLGALWQRAHPVKQLPRPAPRAACTLLVPATPWCCPHSCRPLAPCRASHHAYQPGACTRLPQVLLLSTV